MLLYYQYTVYIDERRTSPCFHAYVGAEREADARGMLREELKQIPAFLRISEADGAGPVVSALPLAADTTKNLQKLHTDSTRHNGFSTIYLHGGCKTDTPNHRHVPFCTRHVLFLLPDVPVLYSPCSSDVTFLYSFCSPDWRPVSEPSETEKPRNPIFRITWLFCSFRGYCNSISR
jgi:hypothetical protein